MSVYEQSGSGEISAATQALTQAAEALNRTTNQLAQFIGERQHTIATQNGAATTTASPAQINAFEDDPFSEATPTANPATAVTTIANVPVNNNPQLQVRVTTPEPAPGRFSPATADFRHWEAKESLIRAINFWAPLLPAGTRWSTVNPMAVTLVAGQTLNANYSRTFGLRFYQQTVRNVPIFSAASPDVACHELGHAILDALRPQLFNAPFTEVAAFHEGFGDISAMLSSLQLPTLRRKVLAETHGRLNVNSRLSRLAEQLGWAIRQLSPTAVDRDSLRNAANRFFYRPPNQLPPSAPATQLSSEAHSFSRVFTGAILDALARMLPIAGGPSDANLLKVSRDLGILLTDGIRTAPIVPAYFSQVAASMIQADQVRNNRRYRAALTSAFIGRGILSAHAITELNKGPLPQFKAFVDPATQEDAAYSKPVSDDSGLAATNDEQMMLDYDDGNDQGYLLGPAEVPELPLGQVNMSIGITVLAHVGTDSDRFGVAPGAFATGETETPGREQAAAEFVEDLIQLQRIDVRSSKEVASEFYAFTHESSEQITHTLIDSTDGPVLKRLHFDCGFHHS